MEKQAKTIVFERLLKLIDDNPEKLWNIQKISSCTFITAEVLDEYDKKIEKHEEQSSFWDTSCFWELISYDENKITLDIVEKYPDKPWDWGGISQNSNITMDMIE